jgi:hypothetical protein
MSNKNKKGSSPFSEDDSGAERQAPIGQDPPEPEGPQNSMTPEGETGEATKDDTSRELEAIRSRICQRRQQVKSGGKPHELVYNSTDLADAEWLLVELDKALGHECCLTPAETAELEELKEKRNLKASDQEVWSRISSKHGKGLTPDEMVMKDHLVAQQDAKLSNQELKRYRELQEKSDKKS